jgi:hypothetical protein
MPQVDSPNPPAYTSFSLADLIAAKTATWAAYAPDGLKRTRGTPENPLSTEEWLANREYNRNVLIEPRASRVGRAIARRFLTCRCEAFEF